MGWAAGWSGSTGGGVAGGSGGVASTGGPPLLGLIKPHPASARPDCRPCPVVSYVDGVTEIHDLTARELAAAVRAGDVSPTDVAEHTIERAERLGPQVGAFVAVTEELARRQAAAAERTLPTGGHLPPLLGVPCPIKDLSMVAGVPVSFGSAAFAGTVAETDDGVVTLLRRAGTLMVGKTATPEFGLPCYTEPGVAPAARSPWDLTRSAGGSSGGAAAAVAAGIVPVAHASDGGGSIRVPAPAVWSASSPPVAGSAPGRSRSTGRGSRSTER